MFSGSLLIHEQQYWANSNLLAVSYLFFFWNLRFMRINYLLRAPAGVHCVILWKASCWRHIKQQEHWDYPHFQRFHHKDNSPQFWQFLRLFWITQWLKASISFRDQKLLSLLLQEFALKSRSPPKMRNPLGTLATHRRQPKSLSISSTWSNLPWRQQKLSNIHFTMLEWDPAFRQHCNCHREKNTKVFIKTGTPKLLSVFWIWGFYKFS